MNRFMEILVSTSCVLSLLILSACEHSETRGRGFATRAEAGTFHRSRRSSFRKIASRDSWASADRALSASEVFMTKK